MSGRWQTSLGVTTRRPSFWLVTALVGNALVWLLLLNHEASLSLDATQSLFGLHISHGYSMGLVLLELAGVPLFGIMIVAAVAYASVRGRRPLPIGLCSVCGYDLRATPERCPECGSVGPAAQPPDDRPLPSIGRPRRGA